MYPSVRNLPDTGETPSAEATRNSRVVTQNVIALGMCSFFTDISSEMVLAVVPLFLTTSLGFSILGFGLFEAAYQATNAVFRVWGGSIADHTQSHKRTAASGYAISTATRFGLVASALVSWVPAVPFLLADRIGKGIRTAPRDALISLSTRPDRLAMAFGVHRTLDTAGALLGPLVAFAVLTQAPGSFDAVFVLSAVAGVIGLAVIVTFAQEKPQAVAVTERRPRIRAQWRELLSAPDVRRLSIGVAALSAFTVSDAFVYLVIQRSTDLSARYFPLLFVGTAVVYLALAVPIGRLADRIGTRPVFLVGHVVLLAMYLLLGFSDLQFGVAVACLGILGFYYACTDGVVAAMASRLVPAHLRASGIAMVTVVIAVAKMISAGLFGVLWQTLGRGEALATYTVALMVATLVGSALVPDTRQAT